MLQTLQASRSRIMRGEGNSCPFPPGSSPRPAAALYQCAMYQQGAYEQRDALDRFLGQAPVQHASSAYSPHSNPYQAASPMVADNTPLYGSREWGRQGALLTLALTLQGSVCRHPDPFLTHCGALCLPQLALLLGARPCSQQGAFPQWAAC